MSEKKISLPLVGSSNVDSAPLTRQEGGNILTEIEREVTEHKVVLYMKGTPQQPMCGFSDRAASILDSYGITYHAVNVLADPEKRQGIKDYSDWPTIPQVYVSGEFLGGSDLLAQMYDSGQLDEIIRAAFD